MRIAAVMLACGALGGCATQLSGYQSVSSGASTTVTSSAVAGSASITGARVSLSSGAASAPGAPGGQASLGRGGSAALVVGAVLIDAIQQLGFWFAGSPPTAHALPASISHTCSCYGYQPPLVVHDTEK